MKQNQKNWLLLFLCILCYGFGIFIVYIPTKLINSTETNNNSTTITTNSYIELSLGRLLGVFLIACLTTKLKYQIINSKKLEYFFITIAPLTSSFGYITYNILIKRGGNLSIVSPLTNLYIVIPVCYGIIVLKDKMNILKYIGFPTMIGSVIMIGMGIKTNTNRTFDIHIEDILLILSTIFLWGISSVINIYSLKRVDYNNFIHINLFGNVINTLLSLFFPIQLNPIVITGHFIISIGAVSIIIVSSDSDTSKWTALSQLSVLITLMLSLTIFKESISILTTIGVITLIFSSIMVSANQKVLDYLNFCFV